MIGLVYWAVGMSAVRGQAACNSLAGLKTTTANDAFQCYYSLPLTKEIQLSQLDTIAKTLQFYAFLDISRRGPDPEVPSHIHLENEIETLKRQNFTGAFHLHRSIRDVFVRNKDGHTVYNSPCFEQFMFRQPFPMMAAESVDGRQIIRIVENILLPPEHVEFWKEQGINIHEFEGAEVFRINSWPVLEYLRDFGEKVVGVSRDPNTRLSLSLSHPMRYEGEWGVTYGIHMSTKVPPTGSYISYSLITDAGPRELKIPYLVTVPKSFKVGSDYYSMYCRPGRAAEARSRVADYIEHQEVQEILEMTPDAITPPRDSRIASSPIPEHDGEFSQAYLLNNGAGVLSLSSFSTRNATDFYRDIQRSLNVLKRANKLVIDLSNNGGGVICFGYHVLDAIIETPRFPTDLRLTPLLAKMVERSQGTDTFLDPKYWSKPDGTNFADAKEFLAPRYFNRGVMDNRPFTQPFIDNCPPSQLPIGKKFKPKDIAVMSNGICFSTCALISNALQEHHKVPTYVVGGDQTKPSTVATLAGGTIYTLDKLLVLLNMTNLLNHPDAPKPFRIDADFSFTIREAYSSKNPSNPIPLEFKWFPADYHLKSTSESFNHPEIIWDAISSHLKSLN